MTIAGFFIRFTLFAALVAGLAWGIQYFAQPTVILSPNFTLQLVYLYFLTAIVYLLSIFGIKKGPEYGVYAILGGIVIKLLFALSLFLVIVVKSSENQLVLGLNFFSIYLLFTAFEVTVLLRKLRHQNKM